MLVQENLWPIQAVAHKSAQSPHRMSMNEHNSLSDASMLLCAQKASVLTVRETHLGGLQLLSGVRTKPLSCKF